MRGKICFFIRNKETTGEISHFITLQVIYIVNHIMHEYSFRVIWVNVSFITEICSFLKGKYIQAKNHVHRFRINDKIKVNMRSSSVRIFTWTSSIIVEILKMKCSGINGVYVSTNTVFSGCQWSQIFTTVGCSWAL